MKNRLITFLIIAFVLTVPETLFAQENRFGIGAQLFSPAGITLKADINEQAAVTGMTSFIISDGTSQFTLQANVILKDYRSNLNIQSGSLFMYYGAGVQATFNESFSNIFSLRAPLGVEYEFENNPLGIYMDLAPTIRIEPNVTLFFSSSMGIRYYFE